MKRQYITNGYIGYSRVDVTIRDLSLNAKRMPICKNDDAWLAHFKPYGHTELKRAKLVVLHQDGLFAIILKDARNEVEREL